MMSEQTNELFTALAKAQGEFTVAPINKVNPHFKSRYSDLQSYLASARPSLSKHGLSVIQTIDDQDGRSYLITTLGHNSGQWIKSKMLINPTKNDMQGFGSALSYARRYSYAAIIGLASGEEDDDGNEAVEVSQSIQPAQPKRDKITKEQYDELMKHWKVCSEDHRKIRTKILSNPPHNIKSLEDLPKNIYAGELELARLNAQIAGGKNGSDSNNE